MPSNRKAVRQMVETRRLYRFERVFFTEDVSPFISKLRPIGYLRNIANTVWAKHGRRGVGVPEINVDPNVECSHCTGYRNVVLLPEHCSLDVLLHELTHCIGYLTHSRAFVRKYVELLVEYGGCSEIELTLALGLFKVDA